ncbi:MAG: adenylosuccinate synthetase, partial [Proteobacteria bacterium]|nr:adenylosuccinate synthetase [Pseudomonadota bacterium]
ICTGYRFRGKTYSEVPSSLRIWQECKPVYEEMDTWSEDISAVKQVEKLPRNAKRYVREIEKLIGAKIMLVSIGNERKQTILLENPFKKVHTGKAKKGR